MQAQPTPQATMESFIVRIYRRPAGLGAVGAAGAGAGAGAVVVQVVPPGPPDGATLLAGTVQALGEAQTPAQTFDSAQALLKRLGLDGG
jgi:hypothetical protein